MAVLTLSANRNEIDVPAFLIALILAPLVPAVGLFFLIVPIFAVPIGIVPYLLFGGPAYWWTLRTCRNPAGCTGALILAGLIANCGTYIFYVAYGVWTNGSGSFDAAYLITMLGFIAAPLWSMAFARLYQILARPIPGDTPANIFE